MDSWTLQGDSYSFTRSAPRTFSLCHRDGTPNHVEIFDIINIPNQRTAISETTCLCDIFGDGCESPSVPTSSATGACVLSQREVEGIATASPLVDELNDSSGSYHTAQGSSEGEELFEDSRERVHSPILEPKSSSPLPHLNTTGGSSEILNTDCSERTPSSGHNCHRTLSPEGGVSPCSSSSVETTSSPSSHNQRQVHTEAETRCDTPTSKDGHINFSPSLNQSTSPGSNNFTTAFSSDCVCTQSLPDFRKSQVSPEPNNLFFDKSRSPSPGHTPKDLTLDFISSTFQPRVLPETNLSSSSSTDLSSQSRETLLSPELKTRSCSPDTDASSPFPELRGRISLPDLFSRSTTPGIVDSPCTPELNSDLSISGRDSTTALKSNDTRLLAGPGRTLSTPTPRYTPPSPVGPLALSLEFEESCVSPGTLSTASLPEIRRSPSPSPSPQIAAFLPKTPCFSSSTQITDIVRPAPSHSPQLTSGILLKTPSFSPSTPISEIVLPGPPSPSPSPQLTASIRLLTPSISPSTPISEIISPRPLSQSPSPQLTASIPPKTPSFSTSTEITDIILPGTLSPSISPQIIGNILPQSPSFSPSIPISDINLPRTPPPSPSPHLTASILRQTLFFSPSTEITDIILPGTPSPHTFPQITANILPKTPSLSPSSQITDIILPRTPSSSPSPRITDFTPPRTPSTQSSPQIHPDITSSTESRTEVSSSLGNYSLSSSPDIRKNYSPTESCHGNSTPEIRITTSSPEVSKQEKSSAVALTTDSLDQHSDSDSSRGLTSSPHITRISYSIIQPEDRDTSLFPELSCFSASGLKRTSTSPEERSTTPSRDSIQSSLEKSICRPQDSSHITGFSSCVLLPEASVLHKVEIQTPSPAPRHQTPSDSFQSPSVQQSRDLSPGAPSPVQRYHQHSPTTFSTEFTNSYRPSTLPLGDTPEIEEASPSTNTAEIDSTTNLAKVRLSTSIESHEGDKSIVAEKKSSLPVASVHSPQSSSPSFADKKVFDNSLKHQSAETDTALSETTLQKNSTLASFSEEYNTDPNFFQEVAPLNNFHTETESENLIVFVEDRTPNNSPAFKDTSNLSVQRVDAQPQLSTYPLNSDIKENSSLLKPAYTSEPLKLQPSAKVTRENRDNFMKEMAHYINRRKTPSPPLTRFTPVHIIAPEKPYRQWQNRSCCSPEIVGSCQSDNLKELVTNRESPSVAPIDSDSQAEWVRLWKQLETEREIQLDEKKVIGREKQISRDTERGRKGEEQLPEKRAEWQEDTSYRGEQVELSFNARNRRGPASRSAAHTSRENHQGLPTAHSSTESLLPTRQLQQQQNLPRVQIFQQDNRSSGPNRRLQLPAPQNKSGACGRGASNRPARSSSSSMGSELDDADNEVKWFSDVAFSSLSSSEVDYLDMYNSSHRSSTNISQPSTQESPAGVNAAWLAYADFRGSAQKLDNDDLSFQQVSTSYSDELDPSKCYEMGSFECVDVAVEREDCRKGKRGVPKRQIQLKRKNNAEVKQDETSDNSSPGIPVMEDRSCLESHSRESFVKQHCTPVTMQDCYHSEPSPLPDQQSERDSSLQKCASEDETCTKTKMATCFIKSVLSKKMQSVDMQPNDQVEEETTAASVAGNPLSETTMTRNHSDYSVSSDDLAVRGDPSAKNEAGTKNSNREKSSGTPHSDKNSRSLNFLQTDNEDTDAQLGNATSVQPQGTSEPRLPFDGQRLISNQVPRTGVKGSGNRKPWEERDGGDLANATIGNTGATFSSGANSPGGTTINTEDHRQLQQNERSTDGLKKQEITFKPAPVMEKKKSSLTICVTPEAQNTPEAQCEVASSGIPFIENAERVDTSTAVETEEEGIENNKVKTPIHKVRDVRRLVKNTYNLSFKATSDLMQSNENEEESENEHKRDEITQEGREDIVEGDEGVLRLENKQEQGDEVFRVESKDEVKDAKPQTLLAPLQRGMPLSRPQPMQIECKAVCLKENKNKVTPSKPDSQHLEDKTIEETQEPENASNENTENSTTEDVAVVKPRHNGVNEEAEAEETITDTYEVPKKDKPVVVRKEKKPPMLGTIPKLPSKEREVSTAVVLIRDASSKMLCPPQEDFPTPLPAPAPSASPGPTSLCNTSGNSSHSVSMLLKEKGYQADIGSVVGDGQNASGGKEVAGKHVNSLEIPLQTNSCADGGQFESQRERPFSSSSTTSAPTTVSDNTDTSTKTKEEEAGMKSTVHDTAKQKHSSPVRNIQEQTPPFSKQKELSDFESVKRIDPTFPPRSPAIRKFRPQAIEVKSLSKEMPKTEMSANNPGNNRPQSIEVKSVVKNSQKPAVPPKPSCKYKPADVGAMPNDAQRLSVPSLNVKPQGEERMQTIVVSSPTIYRKIPSESASTSNYTRKLAVSAVSTCKPPPSKSSGNATTDISNQSTASSETEASNDKGQQEQQQPEASLESSQCELTPSTLATASAGTDLTSAPGPTSDLTANQVPGSSSATVSQISHPPGIEQSTQLQNPSMAYPHEQPMLVTSNNAKQPGPVSTTRVPGYIPVQQPYRRSLSSEHSQRTDELHFYASDDPPSYDERESFSPLTLPDLTYRRSHRYQPSTRPPPCACNTGLPPPSHHHRSPRNLTPPEPPHSPGQVIPYPVAHLPLRTHQCRSNPQSLSYRNSSPKSNPLGPSQPPGVYQPSTCPPHSSLIQTCHTDRPLQPPQHMDSRRPLLHHSPQHHPPGVAGAPYSNPGHTHSPILSPMDPQYLCGSQSLGTSCGSEYGGESASLYSESSYGQTPRRVLLDPETGKYFYIEIPVQPLRKMLFDPETGQYVEVLIPQQAMSHSGLYPPSAVPYPPLHNHNMYASAPQYMPYAAPPPIAHPQAQPQPPRYPEASASTTVHSNGAGVTYGTPSSQGSRPEPQNHPPLDQSYLENMYYVPTGMNASPNPTPPDYYHKHPPSLPPTRGKRS